VKATLFIEQQEGHVVVTLSVEGDGSHQLMLPVISAIFPGSFANHLMYVYS